MDIFEFELRYMAYKGMSEKFELDIPEDVIVNLTKRTASGIIEKKLTEVTPDELRVLTMQTYTEYKKKYIEESKQIKIGTFSLADYIERLEYEFKVIKEMGYNTYFLIVQDYINRSKTNNIAVGPGRGSAAGSILSYFVGIIDLDPLIYDLIFERFLNPARISMPDIDTDFEDTKREDVINYVKQKYGENKVASLGTYMSMAAKAAFKDVARVMGMSFDESNKISNLIEGKTIKKSIDEYEEFKNLIEENNEVQKIVDLAIKLEGTVRQTGVHACGIIICPEPTVTYTPIQYPPKTGSKGEKDETKFVTQYDGHYIEDIGLLKMDFLGIRNLSIIKNTIKIIVARHKSEGKEVPKLFEKYFEKMGFYPSLEDKLSYTEIFQKGDTSGVFQFESDGMKTWLKALKPTDINDIIAMVSLYRPGPMEFIPVYIKRKAGVEKIEYLMPEIEEIIVAKYGKEVAEEERRKLIEDLGPFMDITYGIAVYQEQLMRLVQSMAGFSLAEADMLRRGVGKKIKEVVEKIKIDFIRMAEEYHGYKPETSAYIYEKMIMPAADYSFNKSHAACYAIIAYHTAYLKAHFPVEFNAALLRSVEEETDKLSKFIDELKMKGMKVLPPSVNESFNHVAAIKNTIRLGFLSIKGVGFEVGKTIEEEREKNGQFKNLEDFLKRCSKVMNKKSLDSLGKAGAFDEFEDRKTIVTNVDTIQDWLKSTTSSGNQGGLGLFDMGGASFNTLTFKEKHKTGLLEKLLFEHQIYKTFVSAHPFDGLYSYLKGKYTLISMFKDTEGFGEFNILGFVKNIEKFQKKGFFVTIEDLSGEIDFFIKDHMDIKEFDILIIKGYKAKSARLKQITKTTLEAIIEKAKSAGKYNEDDSVMEVRAKRIGTANKKSDDQEVIHIPEVSIPKVETKKQQEAEEELAIEEELENRNVEESEEVQSNLQENKVQNNGPIEIQIPDDISKIKKISAIVKTDSGNTKIVIRGKEFSISEKGYRDIQTILA